MATKREVGFAPTTFTNALERLDAELGEELGNQALDRLLDEVEGLFELDWADLPENIVQRAAGFYACRFYEQYEFTFRRVAGSDVEKVWVLTIQASENPELSSSSKDTRTLR